MKKVRTFIFHPVLIGLFPGLTFLGHNITEKPISDAIRSIILSILFAFAIFRLSRILIRNWHKAGILSSISLILFYLYGNVFNVLVFNNPKPFYFGHQRFLFPFFVIILGLVIFTFVKTKSNLLNFNTTLNFLSCIISIFPIYQITRYELQTSNSLKSQTKTQNQTTSLKISKDELPDIYYVILDGNARNDVLINNFGFDNSQFLTELEALDFYIANCSMSNYAHTNFSITSSLEMGYLDKAHSDITALPRWDETAFVKFRRQYGYQTVIFKNEIVWSKTLDPDVIISFDPTHRGHFGLFRNINQFETMFLQTTLIRVFSFFESSTQQVDENEVLLNTKYNAEKHYFDSIPSIVSLPDPKFELMHFFSTHDPFVFTLDGSFISDASNFFQNYKDSINYTNNRILQVVQKIISYIKMNPIFILQADHGSKKTVDFSDFQRMAILNAYNYPNVDKDKFYPIISPINSFRILLNGYFYQTLPLKAGLHLYTDSNKFAEINNFTLVADQNPACH